MIKSTNNVQVYEEDGHDINKLRSESPSIIIREHWSRKEMVVISMGDKTYTVLARDLVAAIQNSQNAHT